MAKLVAVTDSVFPNLDPAAAVLAKIGAELRLAAAPTPEAILEAARDADAEIGRASCRERVYHPV